MTKKNVKKIYRLLPCSSYDAERIESWLADCAKEGLMLDKRSSSAKTLIRFVPDIPKTVRYRLEPKPKEDGEYSDAPTAEARDLAKEYGWEYVCALGTFYIYRAEQAHAREMNTDLAVQAASYKVLKKQFLSHLCWQFLLSANALFPFVKEPFRYLATFGSVYVISFLLIILGFVVFDLFRVSHIVRLHKKLKENTPMEHDKPWKPMAAFHCILKLSLPVLWILGFGAVLSACCKAVADPKPATADYPGDPPFVTFTDLYPGSILTEVDLIDAYNYYQQLSSDCAPVVLDWRQRGDIQTADGKNITGLSMLVSYYETTSPWLAAGLAKDYLRNAQRDTLYEAMEPLPTPELGLDYVAVYRKILPTILIRHGNIMVKATLSDEKLLYQWAEVMAERLKENETSIAIG